MVTSGAEALALAAYCTLVLFTAVRVGLWGAQRFSNPPPAKRKRPEPNVKDERCALPAVTAQ